MQPAQNILLTDNIAVFIKLQDNADQQRNKPQSEGQRRSRIVGEGLQGRNKKGDHYQREPAIGLFLGEGDRGKKDEKQNSGTAKYILNPERKYTSKAGGVRQTDHIVLELSQQTVGCIRGSGQSRNSADEQSDRDNQQAMQNQVDAGRTPQQIYLPAEPGHQKNSQDTDKNSLVICEIFVSIPGIQSHQCYGGDI